jgi:hypothetical protein
MVPRHPVDQVANLGGERRAADPTPTLLGLSADPVATPADANPRDRAGNETPGPGAGERPAQASSGGLEAASRLSVGHRPDRYRIRILYATTGYDPSAEPTERAFTEGLRELGYVEGRNLVIEFRGEYGKRERLPDLAAERVRR